MESLFFQNINLHKGIVYNGDWCQTHAHRSINTTHEFTSKFVTMEN